MSRIALVDDDRNILTSVEMALEAEGFEVKTYVDSSAAFAAISQTPPDLAVFDIKMPRMDGMELLRRVRQKSDMPVIFLTSKDEEIDEVLGLRMGADDFVRKPFSQRLLVERIRAVRLGDDAGVQRSFRIGPHGEPLTVILSEGDAMTARSATAEVRRVEGRLVATFAPSDWAFALASSRVMASDVPVKTTVLPETGLSLAGASPSRMVISTISSAIIS